MRRERREQVHTRIKMLRDPLHLYKRGGGEGADLEGSRGVTVRGRGGGASSTTTNGDKKFRSFDTTICMTPMTPDKKITVFKLRMRLYSQWVGTMSPPPTERKGNQRNKTNAISQGSYKWATLYQATGVIFWEF